MTCETPHCVRTYECSIGGVVLAAAGSTAHEVSQLIAGLDSGTAACAADCGVECLSACEARRVRAAKLRFQGTLGGAGRRRQGSRHVIRGKDGAGELGLDDEDREKGTGRGDHVNTNHLDS